MLEIRLSNHNLNSTWKNFSLSILGQAEANLSLVFLLISNLINRLHLHQFLGTKTTVANKSLKTDANGAY